ncbi:60S acidic ribosomal protein P1-1 [Linum perenne]
MSLGETACSYALMILHDESIPVTADKVSALVKAANVNIESYWPSLFTKLAEKRNVEDLIANAVSAGGGGGAVAAAPAAAAPAAAAASPAEEEPEEESDGDLGFSLFD